MRIKKKVNRKRKFIRQERQADRLIKLLCIVLITLAILMMAVYSVS